MSDNMDDLVKQFPELEGMVRVARVTIPALSHDERAALLLEQGRISPACRQTPCLPCDGRAALQGCECGCHA